MLNKVIYYTKAGGSNMASGFFAVLDDITLLMDDVAAATKIATRKTAGILGDDLAVNAEKATGFLSSRELPVLWAITKGSLLNKLIIVPTAIALNVFYPAAINVILILGAFYLAYEGAEKIVSYFFHKAKPSELQTGAKSQQSTATEKSKIKSAIITDLILSTEIVIIALGSVEEKTIMIQAITVSTVALIATIGVYGLVGLIVRMDDAGLKLIERSRNKGLLLSFGQLLVNALPVVIKLLTIAGTVALLMVSGEILEHNVTAAHHFLPALPSIFKQLLLGFIAGLFTVAVFAVFKKLISMLAAH